MANPILFKSSICLGFFNVLFVEMWNVPLFYRFYIWMGVLSSALNHGLTNSYLKLLDRALMFFYSFQDMYYILLISNEYFYIKLACLTLLLSAVGCFFLSKLIIKDDYHKKKEVGNKFHLSAHFFLTLAHILIAYDFMHLKRFN